MLRRQSPNFDAKSFLDGPSEMAQRIRDFEWSDHPLGPPDTWSVALRSALGIALNSAFPTCIYWGSELRLLYNDAWSLIPGPRHPACLGERAEDVWSDIWHIIEPQFSQVISSGAGVYVRDQMLPMRRFGAEEETYWDYNFTPIRTEDGSIGGIFNSGNETTDKILRERHTRFLLELSDTFRGMTDAGAARTRALEMLGHHLDVARVGIRQRLAVDDQNFLPIAEQWTAPGVSPIEEDKGDNILSEGVRDDLLDGHVIRFDGRDPARKAVEDVVLRKTNSASILGVPWSQDGETVSILFVHSLVERHWTDLEVQTVEEVLGRLMASFERARAAERERILSREIDHRARNLLAVVQSIVRLARPEEPKVMQTKLLDRISALAKTHSLLSDRKWESLVLRDLVEQELAPYAGDGRVNIRVVGPGIVLSPDHSQAIAMVLHELSTNAAKYGSLSGTGGALSVSWNVTPDNELRFEWIETGGGTSKTEQDLGEGGFGTRLLGLVIEMQLEGRIERELTSSGLRCTIEIPWSSEGT